MLKNTKCALTLLSLAVFTPHAGRAAEEHKVWRAPDAEMGSVSWTGFTLTPEISDNTLHLGGPGSALLQNPGGFRAGLALGYDYQTQALVIGVLGELFHTWMDGEGAGNMVGTYKSEVPDMGSLRARLGYAQGRFMLYGTRGVAVARMTIEDRIRASHASRTMAGWTVGAGVEYAWNRHLTARVEYLHASYGTYSFETLPPATNRVSPSMDPLSLHVAFRF
ncbi:MAG: outer membrane protein [Rhodospirillaceae bacterium]